MNASCGLTPMIDDLLPHQIPLWKKRVVWPRARAAAAISETPKQEQHKTQYKQL
jgi:hypothetical protein